MPTIKHLIPFFFIALLGSGCVQPPLSQFTSLGLRHSNIEAMSTSPASSTVPSDSGKAASRVSVYQDSDYGFSFSYPPSYLSDQACEPKFVKIPSHNISLGNTVSILVVKAEDSRTLEEIADMGVKSHDWNLERMDAVKLDGSPAIKLSYHENPSGRYGETLYAIHGGKNENDLYTFTFDARNSDCTDRHLKGTTELTVFEDILSSFQF